MKTNTSTLIQYFIIMKKLIVQVLFSSFDDYYSFHFFIIMSTWQFLYQIIYKSYLFI